MLLWDRGGGVGVKEILINESIVLRAPGCGVSDGKGLLAEEWEKGKNYEERKNERQTGNAVGDTVVRHSD